ncbi:UDP-glucuronosyl/UDP-glucosyltransferase [Metarhizium rileyi]|uniref:UDP-glucuronosyl/UDP-glucosyltransferase n=1 Tax=Metarhizium rileyi (strain RCEF 4871) TaxID=1649241 RepID=A0A162LRA4_METRR|nr:UDP-glucuronosyl/UDP-glucosyltransferase [Metarhizium rileyi RCEF 4871]
MGSTSGKPLLLFTSFPGEGHTNPVLAVAKHLIEHGHAVAYLSTQAYREKIVSIGAEFLPAEWPLAGLDAETGTTLQSMPIGVGRLAFLLIHIFYKNLVLRVEAVAAALEFLRSREPGREIVIVEDILNMSAMPYRYGRPLPRGFDRMPKTVGISPVSLMLQSQDTAPFMLGLPPDASESGRMRNMALNELVNDGPMKPMIDVWKEAMRQCGCTVTPEGSPFNAWFNAYDATFMLCSPSLEYPISDLPRHVQFAGCLPRRGIDSHTKYPAWWSDVADMDKAGPQAKKIVFVSQGTVSTNWDELIVPTLAALAGRDDVLTVAALGLHGAELPRTFSVPANARVADYLPYDAVLPYARVFISNAGYGAFGHAVMNGVPAIFAGETEEKPEVAMRAEWAGFAYNLRTQTPSGEQIRQAVDAVLADDRYRVRARELRTENEELDALAVIERQICTFVEDTET